MGSQPWLMDNLIHMVWFSLGECHYMIIVVSFVWTPYRCKNFEWSSTLQLKTKPGFMACSKFKNPTLSPKIEICCGRILIIEDGKVVRKFEFSKDYSRKKKKTNNL